MEPTRYYTPEFDSVSQLLPIVGKLRRHYKGMFVEATPDQDITFGSLKGKGPLPPIMVNRSVKLFAISMEADFSAAQCSADLISRMCQAVATSPLARDRSEQNWYFVVSAKFDYDRKADALKYSLDGDIRRKGAALDFQIEHKVWDGGEREPTVTAAVKKMVSFCLPVRIGKRRGKFAVLGSTDDARSDNEKHRFSFQCNLINPDPVWFGALLYKCAEARRGEMKVDWEWTLWREWSDDSPEKTLPIYQWARDQNFPCDRYEVGIGYQVSGPEALPFLKSLGGRQKSFKVEVGQIVWPDDWYAQLYLETQGDRYRMFVGLKHDPDETRKVLAEMQQAGGVTLRKERCVG